MDRGQLITLINENVGNESLYGTDSDHSLFFGRLLLPHSLSQSMSPMETTWLPLLSATPANRSTQVLQVDSPSFRSSSSRDNSETLLLLRRHVDPIGTATNIIKCPS